MTSAVTHERHGDAWTTVVTFDDVVVHLDGWWPSSAATEAALAMLEGA